MTCSCLCIRDEKSERLFDSLYSDYALLKQSINKRCDHTAFCKNNYRSKKEQHNYNRQQPVSLSDFQKFPELGYN